MGSLQSVPLGNYMTAGIELAVVNAKPYVRRLAEIDCRSLIVNDMNHAKCDALTDVLCMRRDKPCKFRAPEGKCLSWDNRARL